MVTPELLTYVQDQKAAGVADEQLRQILSAQGWFGDDINAAMNPSAAAPSAMAATAAMGMKSELPPEARGWSWGAAGLTWIWGIKFKVWLSFVTFVLNGIWWIVLGIKGREWAWQAGQWKSVEEFKAAMRPWDRWGMILFILSLLAVAGYVFFFLTALLGANSNVNPV